METFQPPSPPPTVDVFTVYSQTKRIIRANSRLFLTLSILFLLPLSISEGLFSTLDDLLADQILVFLTDFAPETDQLIVPTKTFLLALANLLLANVSSLCAVASITYSVFHGFYGRPVELVSAIKCIFFSFFPLLGTVIVSEIIVFGMTILLLFLLPLFLVSRGAELLGFEAGLSLRCLLVLTAILAIVVMMVMLYLQLTWYLACAVAVVESKWVWQSLRRSASLMKGMKMVAFYLTLLFLVCHSIFMWASYLTVRLDRVDDLWEISWGSAVQFVWNSIFLMMVLVYSSATNTVLYIYCKAAHGELALENTGDEYVGLPPFDDEKGTTY